MNLTYLQKKTLPYLDATLKKGAMPLWKICRNIRENMPSPSGDESIRRLVRVLYSEGLLQRAVVNKEHHYSIAKGKVLYNRPQPLSKHKYYDAKNLRIPNAINCLHSAAYQMSIGNWAEAYQFLDQAQNTIQIIRGNGEPKPN